MSKHNKPAKLSKPAQPIGPSGVVPSNSISDDEHWRNFAKLGDEFLEASRFSHEGFAIQPTMNGLRCHRTWLLRLWTKSAAIASFRLP